LDRVPENLNIGYVGTWLVEAQEGIVVVDVLSDVIWEIFEILKRAQEISVHSVDVL
jgi:hypothetical protein